MKKEQKGKKEKPNGKLGKISILRITALLILLFSLLSCQDPISGSKTKIAQPELEQSHFTYDGSPHTVALTTESAAYTLGGDITATVLGTYTAIVSVTDTGNYEWEDGTTEPFQLNWIISSFNITITPEADQSKCIGTDDPIFTFTYSPPLFGNNTFTGALSRAEGEDINTYAFTLGTLSAGGNYTLSLASGVVFSINAHDYGRWVPTVSADNTRTVSLVETCTMCPATSGEKRTHITSAAEFATVMAELPTNTADTPYTILLNVNDLGGQSGTIGSIGATLRLTANANKFVNLVLSGSNLSSIQESAFSNCSNLTSIL